MENQVDLELVKTLLVITVGFLAATLAILVWQIFFPVSWQKVWEKLWPESLKKFYRRKRQEVRDAFREKNSKTT